MKAIILAGGKGTRLQSVVSDLPKPLAPVQGQPFIKILIRFLRFHGINEVIISTHHLADKFEDSLNELNQTGAKVSLVKEPLPLGTGGAVRFICKSLAPNERVLVLNGDTFFAFNLASFIKTHKTETALALKHIHDASRYGTVKLNGNRVQSFIEKAPNKSPGIIYAGYCILWAKDVLGTLPEGACSLENDFFPKILAKNGSIEGTVFSDDFIDIGVPEDYMLANTKFDFSQFS